MLYATDVVVPITFADLLIDIDNTTNDHTTDDNITDDNTSAESKLSTAVDLFSRHRILLPGIVR